MMLIRTDNFGREGPGHDDVVLCDDIDMEAGSLAAILLNDRCRCDDNGGFCYCPNYYKVVKPDYKLQVFVP